MRHKKRIAWLITILSIPIVFQVFDNEGLERVMYGVLLLVLTIISQYLWWKSFYRTCIRCGKSYEHAHPKTKYCSDKCRMEAWEARTGRNLKEWTEEARKNQGGER